MTSLEELLHLAESRSWQDRSRSGQGLVARLGEPTVDAVVLRLLLDAHDTAVTTTTANSLLARGDLASWRIFASAWKAAAELPSMTNYIDRLNSCLNGAMYIASLDSEKAVAMKDVVRRLSIGDEDENLRSAAREICNLVLEGL